ncbi:MAG: sugar phosphate isomerase/epimerase family protein [Pseudomonadota bacterium]
MFKLGYNTNGFTNHSLISAIDVIGSSGYQSIAITIDHHSLNPGDKNLESQIEQVKTQLDQYRLSSILETGARFLLDPYQKHEPTLISNTLEKRQIRIQFIENCMDIAASLGSDCVSIWSGKKPMGVEDDQVWEWLISACRHLACKARQHNIVIAFEPEPGMFVENMTQYRFLKQQVNHPCFKLTLDLGHALISEVDVIDTIHAYKTDIINIHLEDMKKNHHEHLFFGQGDMDFNRIFFALNQIAYTGQVNIELSRHSHNAVEISKAAFNFLRQIK